MQLHLENITFTAHVSSKEMGRKIKLRIVAPPSYRHSKRRFPVLLMNDGQDYMAMNLDRTLQGAFHDPAIAPFVYVGIEAGPERLQEYGTAVMPDFKGRGSKARQYSKFIVEELRPLLTTEFRISNKREHWVFCGMSLGGLSAFDLVFNHPASFGKVGVLSGSFWWRKKAFIKGDVKDRSRIVLDMVKNAPTAPPLDFWFMCGTHDEKSDRNNNGIIDSIDDTQDLIKELQYKGYSYPGDITYVEVKGGRHDQATWGAVFPKFLSWAFGEGTMSVSPIL